ncbi:hypothetical protein FHS91_001277 [Sphingobium xanthum]|jgi:hypothetical protein|uniref:hypothetical protein n=1 Tax=Sphingobium xanthum TaxID=1387165 RepID=UPI001C8B5DC7|nr:hypothetical protein [Sphingobium xanthum]
MIDTFSLLLVHGLILLTCVRLLGREDLDDEAGGERLNFLGQPRRRRRRKSRNGRPPDA